MNGKQFVLSNKNKRPQQQVVIFLVAGAGFEPATFGL